jgi:predicted MPP superfamily phosphohydrolase
MLLKKNVTITIPEDVEELKIVFFTDTHFGKYYSQEKVTRLVDFINEQSPDFVIFGGDLIDSYKRDQELLNIEKLSSSLKKIKATYGKIAVYGNHDYGGGSEPIYEKIMTGGGFKVLRDDELTFSDLNLSIVGYDDFLLGTVDPNRYKLPDAPFRIVVTHEPDVVDNIRASGSLLVLAGHSHGGQVTIPFMKRVLRPGAEKYIKGQYDLSKTITGCDATMVVSQGIGMTLKPFRFLNPPNIVIVSLKH